MYVFTRNKSQWAQQAYVKASNTGNDDRFGSSITLFDDTLAVGAPGEKSSATGIDGNQGNNSLSEAGAVYVFTRNNSQWAQQAYVKASNTGNDDRFGSSITLFDDTLAVGAPGENSKATGIGGNQGDNSLSDAGAVYVFTRNKSQWDQQAYVKASNTDDSDLFGSSVALCDDTLAAGATGEDSQATGINGNQGDNSLSDTGPCTHSPAAAISGASRPTSRPPTPVTTIALAAALPCAAADWQSVRPARTARQPASTVTRPTTA